MIAQESSGWLTELESQKSIKDEDRTSFFSFYQENYIDIFMKSPGTELNLRTYFLLLLLLWFKFYDKKV